MKVKVYFNNDQDKVKVGIFLRSLIRRAIKGALAYENFTSDAEVSVTFTDNHGIRALNLEYREIDRETDVLSFPMYDFHAGEVPDEGGAVELGDIVLSLEKAEAQAVEYGHSFKREAAFLTVHSVLHLLGYDHERSENDEKLMFRRQGEIMELLGIPRK